LQRIEFGKERSNREQTMKVYLNPDEIKLMEEAATCLRDRLLIRVLFRLGCRVSEALALTVDDVDFAQGTVTIQHLKSRLRLLCLNCQTRLGKSILRCPSFLQVGEVLSTRMLSKVPKLLLSEEQWLT
jgi:integrase